MKIILFIFLFDVARCTPPTTVYVCDSENSTKYHYREDCRGLKTCNYRIIKITLEKAVKEKKTVCGWEKDVKNS
jgi:5-bromo-4-chloroindolyl phosphate hydrolysis protein